MVNKSPRRESDYVAQAKDILRKKVPKPKDPEVLNLTKQLKQEKARK